MPLTMNDNIRMLATGIRGVLCTTAANTGTRFDPWNQYLLGLTENYNTWLGRGMCRGLSLLFLDTTARGFDFRDIATRKNLTNTGRYEPTWLQTEVFNAALPGNMGDGDQALYDFARKKYGMVMLKRKELKGGSELASFVTGEVGYYLISSEGHAMAAVSRLSGYTFFDPNGGLISSASKKDFSSALDTFFGHWFIKEKYGHNHKVKMTVFRFSHT